MEFKSKMPEGPGYTNSLQTAPTLKGSYLYAAASKHPQSFQRMFGQ
jgi:hypothetical protein